MFPNYKVQNMKSKGKNFIIFVFTAAICLILMGCSGSAAASQNQNQAQIQNNGKDQAATNQSGSMSVHFIDVGQGDSTLFISDGVSLLIDAGDNKQEGTVTRYLENQGISKLDYVILTHPDADHAGGMDSVIQSYDIGTIIMPPVTHTTKTFEDVLDSIAKKELRITKPVTGTSYSLGSGAFTIIAPSSDYGDDLNNWSVGVKVTNGDNSFVLCGDAETEAEHDIAGNGIDLSADVLKLGHHGSSTSSSKEFLDAVKPFFAVISCGKDNSYGHPHKETLEKITEREIQLFRTDLSGTVIALSDGTNITWNTGSSASVVKSNEHSALQESQEVLDKAEETEYILNTNTKKFHLPACSSVSQMKEENREVFHGTREELIDTGYNPCKNCNP